MSAATERKQPRGWDFFLTSVFILVLLVLTGIFVTLGIGFGLNTLGCSGGCDLDAIGIGAQVTTFGSPVVALIAIIVAVVFIARRKVAFWVPLVGILVIGGLYVLGAFLVSQGVPVG